MNELAALAEKLGPEVTEQMLRWGIIANYMGLVTCLGLLVIWVVFLVVGIKKEWDKDLFCPAIIATGVMEVFVLVVMVCCICEIIQIAVAPYAYLADKVL